MAYTLFEPNKLPAPSALDYRNQINVDFPASRSSIFSGLACSACVSLPPFLLSFLPVSHSPVSVPLAPLLFRTPSLTHPLDFFRFRCKQAGAHVPTVRHGINHSLIGKSQRANTVADGRQIRGTGKREVGGGGGSSESAAVT